MTREATNEDFVLSVIDVFTITNRGTVVVGSIESGVLHNGDEVEIWDEARLVATARANIEFICSRTPDPRSVALVLGDVPKGSLRPGQTVKRHLVGEPAT